MKDQGQEKNGASSNIAILPLVARTLEMGLSRRDSIIDRLKGRLAGATVYLSKPFKTQELVSVVKTQLGIAPAIEQEAFQNSLKATVVA